MRSTLAGLSAKTAARLARLGGGGATSLPGVVGLRVDPRFIRTRSRSLAGSVVITGTNGKTTTSRFIQAVLEKNGKPIVHNAAGSNLLRGIATALALAKRPRNGKKLWGVFEVDEATVPAACRELRPKVVVVTNLFRDQLDRYGELKRTASLLRDGLTTLPKTSTVLLNADDPLVAALGKGLRCKVRYFGIEDTSQSKPGLPHAAESVSDPRTKDLLRYDAVFVGHLGHYRGARLKRPKPQVRLDRIERIRPAGNKLSISTGRPKLQVDLKVPGLYNAYNALAAVAVADTLRIKPMDIAAAIGKTDAVFGRQEALSVDGKTVRISLIKNPTGANEVIHTLGEIRGKKHFLVLINDNFADGLDVSWLWDTDFEALAEQAAHIGVGGLRGTDMALRLKYAGIEAKTYESIEAAVTLELRNLPKGATLYILPTYTALLELRRGLSHGGHVKHFLE